MALLGLPIFLVTRSKTIRNIFLGAIILIVALIVYFIISGIKQGKSPGEMIVDARTLGATRQLTAIPNFTR